MKSPLVIGRVFNITRFSVETEEGRVGIQARVVVLHARDDANTGIEITHAEADKPKTAKMSDLISHHGVQVPVPLEKVIATVS